MKFLNWLLYQFHRWLGVVLALFMFVWLSSGLVIMYSTPTTQNRSQQLAYAETLTPESGWLSLAEVWQRSHDARLLVAPQRQPKPATEHAVNSANPVVNREDGIAEARLLRQAGEPVWLVEDLQGIRFALSALDGSLRETKPEQALAIAEAWWQAHGKADLARFRFVETVEYPIILRNQDSLRPFHRVQAADKLELLISSRTGEVLHASTALQRGFYWAGNWIHTFKPLDSLGFGHIRHGIQTWAGLLASIATLTGLIIGWLRWRPGFNGKPTYSQGRKQPYREFWFKWHFWTGLIGGSFALFWTVSGFLETNPWQWFSPANYSKAELVRYLGKPQLAKSAGWQPTALPFASTGLDVVEIAWRRLGDETVLQAFGRDGQRIGLTIAGANQQVSNQALNEAVKRLAGENTVRNQTTLTAYDSYYYPRHHQGLNEKPLPVIRVELDDAGQSLFYIDPQDGRLLTKLDQSRRVFRWLYSALHHWDFGWLYYRPVWDVWMLSWVLMGIVLGASAVVLSWRRLKITFVPKKARKKTVPLATEQLITE